MPDIFDVDITTGKLRRKLEDGTELETTIGELGGKVPGSDRDRLQLSGRMIRDGETGQFIGALSAEGLNRIEQLGDGRLLLFRPLQREEVNQSRYQGGRDAVSFNWEMELPTGLIINGEVPFSMIANVDARLIARSTDTPNPRFESLVPEINRETGVIENLPLDARFATPDEAIQRNMVAVLLDRFRNVIEDIKAMALTDETGRTMETDYDVAEFIARGAIKNISALHVREL